MDGRGSGVDRNGRGFFMKGICDRLCQDRKSENMLEAE